MFDAQRGDFFFEGVGGVVLELADAQVGVFVAEHARADAAGGDDFAQQVVFGDAVAALHDELHFRTRLAFEQARGFAKGEVGDVLSVHLGDDIAALDTGARGRRAFYGGDDAH